MIGISDSGCRWHVVLLDIADFIYVYEHACGFGLSQLAEGRREPEKSQEEKLPGQAMISTA